MCTDGSSFNKDFNVIYLRVVRGCNLNCSHCFTMGTRDSYSLAPLEYIESFLKSIKENVNPQHAVVYIHGGEPFLAPYEYLSQVNGLIKKILSIKKVNIIPQTNLMYRVDEKYTDFIKQEYAGNLGVSWDYGIRFGTTSSAFNEDLFFGNFKKVVASGANVAVAITVQKHLMELNPVEVVKKFEGAKSLDFEFLTTFDEKTSALKVPNKIWSKFYLQILQYYAAHSTTWSLPLADLFTKSFLENRIYQCKCNCCQNRTFTMNVDGSVGLCPDDTYYAPISTVQELSRDWEVFAQKAMLKHAEQIGEPINELCQTCEFYEHCGGNCEASLFLEGEDECPMSRESLAFQLARVDIFKNKLNSAYANLPELKKEV